MTPEEIASKLEAIDRGLHDWKRQDEPKWMASILSENRHLLRDAATLIRSNKEATIDHEAR